MTPRLKGLLQADSIREKCAPFHSRVSFVNLSDSRSMNQSLEARDMRMKARIIESCGKLNMSDKAASVD